MTEKKPHGKTYIPTPEEIDKAARAAEAGVTERAIAKMLGIDYKTYQKAVQPQIEHAIGEVKQFVVGQLFQLIKNGEPSAIYFYLKTRCGWRQTDKKIENAIEDLRRNVLAPTIGLEEWKQEVIRQEKEKKKFSETSKPTHNVMVGEKE